MTGYDPSALRPVTPSPSFLSSSPRLNLDPRIPSTTVATNTSSSSSSASLPFFANAPPPSDPLTDTLSATTSLLTFLHLLHVSTPPKPHSHPHSRRYTTFHPPSPLYSLLTSTPGPRPGVRDPTYIQSCCRLASAFYLCAVLLEFSHDHSNSAATSPTTPATASHPATAYLPSPPAGLERAEAYLKRLTHRIVEQELDWHVSIEALTWILLYGDQDTTPSATKADSRGGSGGSSGGGGGSGGNGWMGWWVGRMMNVVKRLEQRRWREMEGICLAFLQGRRREGSGIREEEEGEGEGEGEAGLEGWLGEVREECLRAPLSSHLEFV
ncbi:MAG: hypothetical protein Q9227_008870 [Pyrenula ochraceoflavens]